MLLAYVSIGTFLQRMPDSQLVRRVTFQTYPDCKLIVCSKTGASGVMAEGKDRYQDYKTDAADGKVNWMQQGKNALTDYKADTAVILILCYKLLIKLSLCCLMFLLCSAGCIRWSCWHPASRQPHVTCLFHKQESPG